MENITINTSKLWGEETEKSLENFNLGIELIPKDLIIAFAYLKKSCAIVNYDLDKLSTTKKELIVLVCDEIIDSKLDEHFPLHIWQTGSGTQTNMNLNEVIANRAYQLNDKVILNPNDDVNMSQSSNDTFPTAMKIAILLNTKKLLKSIYILKDSFTKKEKEFKGIIKIGRTHLQDAIPLFFSDEISGYSSMLEHSSLHITDSLSYIKELAIGGTAVGTGLNSPKNFSQKVCDELNKFLDTDFISNLNKFHALSSHDSEVFLSGALNSLASNLMKIANDIRWLSSGPKCGIGEINLPINEKGSSIMPGKVNPTQAEALTMIAVQVMGNHTTISIASSQGNFELNVFKPLIIYNLLQSINLLSEGMDSFSKKCIDGITLNKDKIEEYLNSSLMIVTALNPYIGYKSSEKIAKFAYENDITLKQSAVELKILTADEFDKCIDIKKIASGN